MNPKPALRQYLSGALDPEPIRVRLWINGLVQGVGFRPFAFGLATHHGLVGFVLNSTDGVTCEIEGPPAAVSAFRRDLIRRLPPPGRVDGITAQPVAVLGSKRFQIVDSRQSAGSATPPPDMALCDECRRELHDAENRRYRHPFINCTRCGPRFTVIEQLPYDRKRTTMSDFSSCAACLAEFEDPLDRRFHAQNIACNDCGPRLSWKDRDGLRESTDPIVSAATALADGKIVAIKGLGGYHVVCNAEDDEAVRRLRSRKGRIDKPFAVLVSSLEVAGDLVELSFGARRSLESSRGMIVLLRRRSDGLRLAPGIAPDAPELGVILPYIAVHDLLFAPESGRKLQALVMTSGNVSGEPIVTDDDIAMTVLDGIADCWLWHDRRIAVPCDDSVVRTDKAGIIPVRCSRGFAPMPIEIPMSTGPLLALGGDIKTCICLANRDLAWMSAHIGDMERVRSQRALAGAVEHLETILNIRAERLVVDQHPNYRTVQWADGVSAGRPIVRVQHHQAHLASLIVESKHPPTEPVLGFVFDGAGYGSDGLIWGGEVFVASDWQFQRVGSLAAVWQPGGDAAVRRPYRMALSHLAAAGVDWSEEMAPVRACPPDERVVLRRQVTTGLNSNRTSSMGRLFDAVSSLSGICQVADYEAEAAMRFEGLATTSRDPAGAGYRFPLRESDGLLVARPEAVVRQVVADLARGLGAGDIALKFHLAVANLIAAMASRLAVKAGVKHVGLSGGVFLNGLLSDLAEIKLTEAGFSVLRHRIVPPSDGGIALGQIAIAAHSLLS